MTTQDFKYGIWEVSADLPTDTYGGMNDSILAARDAEEAMLLADEAHPHLQAKHISAKKICDSMGSWLARSRSRLMKAMDVLTDAIPETAIAVPDVGNAFIALRDRVRVLESAFTRLDADPTDVKLAHEDAVVGVENLLQAIAAGNVIDDALASACKEVHEATKILGVSISVIIASTHTPTAGSTPQRGQTT